MSRHPMTIFSDPFVPFEHYVIVEESVPPAFDAETHQAVEGEPHQSGDGYTQTWLVQSLTQDELDQREAERAAADQAARDAARITISRTQGLIFLYRTLGVMESHIDAMLAEQEDEAERYEAGLYFRAANWESDNPFVMMLGERVGLDTPEKLQAAFAQAQTL